MAESIVKVTSRKSSRNVELIRDFGGTLDEAVGLFGEQVVLDTFTAACIIKAQTATRTVLDNPEKSEAEAVAAGEGWKPGVKRAGGGGGKKKSWLDKLREDIAAGKITKKDAAQMIKDALSE